MLLSKELSKKGNHRDSDQGESLVARGRYEKNEGNGKNRSRSKSKPKHNGCFICNKEGHYKKNCPDNEKNAFITSDMTAVSCCFLLIKTVVKNCLRPIMIVLKCWAMTLMITIRSWLLQVMKELNQTPQPHV